MKKYHLTSSYKLKQSSLMICGCLYILPILISTINGLPAATLESNPNPIYMNSYQSGQMSVDYPNYIVEETKAHDLKRNHDYHETINNLESCCPSISEIIEPNAGKNRSGDLVELYQTDRRRQRFYEISCAEDVVDLPCKYLDKSHSKRSRCQQQYSYTYALVRDMGAKDQGWRLDYILTRSGCSCHIDPITK